MNDRQRQMIRHALGLYMRANGRSRRWAFRNHFNAGTADEPEWRGLEAQGYAVCWRVPFVEGPIFTVTEAGVSAADLARYVPRSLVK